MELSSTNIATAVQLHTAQCLNTALSSLSVEFFPENTRDIDFQVKEALAKQGIACIVATPELEYQGHDMKFATYDATVELQVAENPIINRARMRKEGLSWGTCLDVAVAGCEVLAGPSRQSFMKYVPTTIEQENEGAIIVARAQLQTHAWPREPKTAWKVVAWPSQPSRVGEVVQFHGELDVPPDVRTTWGEDGGFTIEELWSPLANEASYWVEDGPDGNYWSLLGTTGKQSVLDFTQQEGGPKLEKIYVAG